MYDLADVVEGFCRLRRPHQRQAADGLFLLPAAQTKDKTSITPDQMKQLVDQLKEEHDYILLIARRVLSKDSRMRLLDDRAG